jgi:hypothetical protein
MWIDDIEKQRTAVNAAPFALDTRTRDGPREAAFEIRAWNEISDPGSRIGQGLALWLCRMSSSTFGSFEPSTLSLT